ncbi:hypothetical protein Tco_0939544 [Tanacetum coccineum]|uniref:Uncharacterized protein n=1 Tax=Tanacetum coccineum TaxID=301880 RepID=A0ABQ5DL39_9ASTR
MSEEKPPVLCVNGCTMTAQEKKSKRPSRWKVIRDERRRLEEKAVVVVNNVVVAANNEDAEEDEEPEETAAAKKNKKIGKRVGRLAEKVFEGKSPEEKMATDFKGDNDAIVMGSGVSKQKALKAKASN